MTRQYFYASSPGKIWTQLLYNESNSTIIVQVVKTEAFFAAAAVGYMGYDRKTCRIVIPIQVLVVVVVTFFVGFLSHRKELVDPPRHRHLSVPPHQAYVL